MALNTYHPRNGNLYTYTIYAISIVTLPDYKIIWDVDVSIWICPYLIRAHLREWYHMNKNNRISLSDFELIDKGQGRPMC